jgi:hypothetical protein
MRCNCCGDLFIIGMDAPRSRAETGSEQADDLILGLLKWRRWVIALPKKIMFVFLFIQKF